MKITMLVLVTLGYYVMLFFLNKRRKTAFEKNAVTVLGDTTSLEGTEDITETDLFGEVNPVDSDTLSELTTLLDADPELASNMTSMIDDVEGKTESAAPSTPSRTPPVKKAKKAKTETVDLVNLENQEQTSKVFPIPKSNLIQALEGLDNQDAIIEESDIDGLMSQMISKQE